MYLVCKVCVHGHRLFCLAFLFSANRFCQVLLARCLALEPRLTHAQLQCRGYTVCDGWCEASHVGRYCRALVWIFQFPNFIRVQVVMLNVFFNTFFFAFLDEIVRGWWEWGCGGLLHCVCCSCSCRVTLVPSLWA